MTEMTWTTLVIGGPMPKNKVNEFRALVREYFGGDGVLDKPDDSIDDALREGRSVSLSGELNFGSAEELEHRCRQWGLTYWKQWDANAGVFDTGIEIWNPGLDEPAEQTAACEQGVPALTLPQLEMAAVKGMTLQEVIADLAKFESARVPPLTIGEADFVDEAETKEDVS